MSSRERQLVYCHECENEWYKEEHGLKCPACHSEFVEELGGNEDPRTELRIPTDDYDDGDPDISVPDEHPLRHHNPWAQLHDPTAHDDDRNRSHDHDMGGHFGPEGGYRVTQLPGGFRMEMRRTFSPGANPNSQAAYGRPPQDPMMDLQTNFFNMVNGIMGGAAGMRGGFATTSGGRGFGNVRVTTASFGGPGGATWRTQTVNARDPDDLQPGAPQFDDLHRMLLGGTFFGGSGMGSPAGNGGPFAGPFAASPLAGLFGMMHPAGAQHGDAVFTQEALDRVISQLMEQNQMGNAPPPATRQDIETLPKVKVTKDMCDPGTDVADCSICMESVPVGEEVTRLWCSHWFHGDCVNAWLREHDSCPQCRKPIAQARDEAIGRATSAPPAQGPAEPESSPSTPLHGMRTNRRRTSSAHDPYSPSGSRASMPPRLPSYRNHIPGPPGAPGHSTPRRASQQDQSQSQAPPQGFADRVRGLFGRGQGS